MPIHAIAIGTSYDKTAEQQFHHPGIDNRQIFHHMVAMVSSQKTQKLWDCFKSPNLIMASSYGGRKKGGRDRTNSAQFLDNKQFAYLFEKSPNKASASFMRSNKKKNLN